MRLKSIKLAGFKSFVDPTTVHFPSNMSAVVGPNGCGKSNVIDAVRWVMGESSAKHLRGESMTDVIFNGSNSRKPVGQASIELIFDNTGGVIQGEFARYNEVSVKRRVSRDGQSQYFLNANKCRKKDVTDLFLGTGLGPRSYAIIEQGMISRLIESKPEELRVFIEEAAGISRYKERRKETESRIKRTRENLDRLTDIREELDRQLQHLNRQARAAERYQELKGEERRTRALLSSFRWQQLDDQAKELKALVQDDEVNLEKLLYERTHVDTQLEKLREERLQIVEQVNAAQAAYYGTGAEIAKIEQQIKHAAERESQLRSELEQLQASLQEHQNEISADQESLAEVGEELTFLEPELEECRERSEFTQDQLAEAEEVMKGWQSEWDAFTQRSNDLQRRAEVEQTRIQQIEKHIFQLGERTRELERERGEQSLGVDEDSLAAGKKAIHDLEEEVDKLAGRIKSVGESEQNLRASGKELDQRLDQNRTRRQQLAGERASLEALQKQGADVFDEKAKAFLQEHHLERVPWLLSQLDVTPEWETAVENILSDWLSARVVSREVFDSLAEVLPPGVMLVADETVKYEGPFLRAGSQCPQAIAERLATWQDSEETHRPTQKGAIRLLKDGSQIGTGWASGPSLDDKAGGALARERRLDSVAQEFQALESDYEALVSERDDLDEKLRELASQQASWQAESVSRNKQLLQLKADISAQEARLEQYQRRQAHIQSEISSLSDQIAEENETLNETREIWQEALMQLEEGIEQKEILLDRRDQSRTKLDDLRNSSRRDREHLHQLELKVSELRSRRQSISGALVKSELAFQRVKDRLETVTAGLDDIQRPGDDRAVELEDYLALRLQQEDQLNQSRDHLAETEKALQDDEVRRQRNEQILQDQRGRLERNRMQLREAEVRRNSLRDQLAEDNIEIQQLLPQLAPEDTETALQHTIEQLVNKINRLGPINLAAIEEYEAQSERKVYLDGQNDELQEALETLENAIRKIDRETRAKFKETFDQVNEGLQNLFPRVFGGGQASLELTGDDLLETGVAIMARPPGKKNSTIHLLSGGEKALTAIALVFAIFQLNPAPFCMLDEVDAPLDDANVGRYARMVKEMSSQVQFIYITHNKIAMEMADQLQGVTMHEPGVSRLVSVDVDEAAAMAQL